jgi:hypothetical protein
MTPEEFAQYTPLLVGWIQQTLQQGAPQAITISKSGFQRLPHYFSNETLQTSKVVIVDRLPVPPLSKMGLTQFQDFERGDFAGITYLDTFFVRRQFQSESLYFHELIHVIQWRLLGPEKFLSAYATGLEQCGYRNSPLEAMAYDAQAAFDSSNATFDAEKLVHEKLDAAM